MQPASGEGNQRLGSRQEPWQFCSVLLGFGCSELSLISPLPSKNLPSRLLLLLCAHGGRWLPRVTLPGLFTAVSPEPPTVPGTKRSGSPQRLPRTAKMSQGQVPGRASNWSVCVRCPWLWPRRGSCAPRGPSEGPEQPHLWEGGRPTQVLEEENVVTVILGRSRKAKSL